MLERILSLTNSYITRTYPLMNVVLCPNTVVLKLFKDEAADTHYFSPTCPLVYDLQM